MPEDDQHCHKSDGSIVSLRASSHQYQQWSKEVDDQVKPENAFIYSFLSWFEINRFFRNVSIPDQHILGEPEIRPEYREGKHEFSKIMNMFFVHEFQVAVVLEVHYEQGNQRHTRNKGACEYIPAIHSGVPVCID